MPNLTTWALYGVGVGIFQIFWHLKLLQQPAPV